MIAARMNVSLAADAAEFHIRRADDGLGRHSRGRGDVPRRINRDAINRYRTVFGNADISRAVCCFNVATLMQPHELLARFVANLQPVVFVRRYGFRQ